VREEYLHLKPLTFLTDFANGLSESKAQSHLRTPQVQHQYVRLRLLRCKLRRGAPIWALLVAFTLQDRLGHTLRSRAGRVDEHW